MRLPPTPCRVCFRPCVFNKFSHFWQKKIHCRCVVCACSAGAVGSFSNKPLSPKSCYNRFAPSRSRHSLSTRQSTHLQGISC